METVVSFDLARLARDLARTSCAVAFPSHGLELTKYWFFVGAPWARWAMKPPIASTQNLGLARKQPSRRLPGRSSHRVSMDRPIFSLLASFWSELWPKTYFLSIIEVLWRLAIPNLAIHESIQIYEYRFSWFHRSIPGNGFPAADLTIGFLMIFK